MPEIVTFHDLELYWADLRPYRVEVSVNQTPVDKQLAAVREEALQAAVKHIRTSCADLQLRDPEAIAALVLDVVFLVMSRWYEHMKHHDLGYLIEVILESQHDLPLSDVKGFIRALPMTILSRLLNESKGPMTGLHALVACEVRRREGSLSDYDIRVDGARRLIVTFMPPQGAQGLSREPLTFALRDIFSGNG